MTTCPLLWSQISLKERLKALEHVLQRADVLKQRVTHCSSWSWLLSFIRSPVKIKGWNRNRLEKMERKSNRSVLFDFASFISFSFLFQFFSISLGGKLPEGSALQKKRSCGKALVACPRLCVDTLDSVNSEGSCPQCPWRIHLLIPSVV